MSLFDPVDPIPGLHGAAGFLSCEVEDPVAQQLLRPSFSRDGEVLLLAGFDNHQRLVRMEHVAGDGIGRCSIPPRCWRALLGPDVATVLMAHNHPSGAPWPSEADIRCTREAAAFLRLLDIELADHLIFVEAGHYSFRRAGLM